LFALRLCARSFLVGAMVALPSRFAALVAACSLLDLFGAQPLQGGGNGVGAGGADDIAAIQERAIQDPRLDALCPGISRSSTEIGAACWGRLWQLAGCKAENVPRYEHWHQAQSLSALTADVVLWANLPDDQHRQGCYGSGGPLASEAQQSMQPAAAAGSMAPGRSSVPTSATVVQTRAELEAVVQRAGLRPVILEFWSEMCGFCTIMSPVFELLAEKYRGRAHFVAVDAQSAPDLAELFQVMGLPAFKSLLGGQLIGQIDGADTGGLERLVADSITEADRHDPTGGVAASTPPRDVLQVVGQATSASLGDIASLASEFGDDEVRSAMRALQRELWRREVENAAAAPDLCAAGSGDVERVVIVGGGPAALAAALYSARAGLCPVVVAPALGGQLMAKGVDVENFPGLLRAHGSSMVQDMRAQAQAFSARFVDDAVASVNVQERPFALRLNASGEVLRTSAVIVAMGADSRWLNVAGEETLRGRGVSTCAACDGFLFRGKACAVIGGGETAMEEALFLARICTSVTVVHRRSTFRARSIPSANPRLRLPTGKFSGNVCWPIQRCLSCGTRRSRSFLARPRHQRQHPAPAMLRIDSWLCCYETPSPSRPNSFLPMRRLWPSATSQTLHSCRDRCACSVLLGTWRQKAEAPPRPCRGSSPPATSRTPSTGRQSLRPAVAPRRRWTRSGG